jgi:hypothetical protein
LLLATDGKGRTGFHLAADILQEILKWAKKKLISQELNNFF